MGLIYNPIHNRKDNKNEKYLTDEQIYKKLDMVVKLLMN